METDTFTAARRKRVDDAHDLLTGVIARALDAVDYTPIIAEAVAIWREVFGEEGHAAEGVFEEVLTASLNMTTFTAPGTEERLNQVERLALWIASFAVNDATASRLDADGQGKEWVTMRDDHVRETHRAVDGKVVPVGGSFSVGGVRMHYPGEPVGNPDLWLGCRCVLRAAEVVTASATEVEDITEEEMEADMAQVEFAPVPWHGVLAPLGVMSGDGRMFAADAEVTTRDLPIPMKYMKKDKSGHEDSVVVANITKVWVENGLILGEGVFADTEEAAEAIAMRAQDMMRGVSVDLDNTESEFRDAEGNQVNIFDLGPDDPEPIMVVTKLRIAAATQCAIPAFQEAYYDLGTWEDEFAMQDCEDCADDGADRPEDQEDDGDDDRTTGAVAVLLPAESDSITAASSEPAHMTLAWFGEAKDLSTEDIAALLSTVASYAATIEGPVTATVSERTTLGEDDADVVMLDGEGIHGLRSGLVDNATVSEVMSRVEQFDSWKPHVTLGYPETPAKGDYDSETVTFDRIGLWFGGEHEEFVLGEESLVAGAFPRGNDSVFRDYSPEERDEMAKKGWAMPDGSFPIADEQDLKNAIQAIGRAKDASAARAHIKKRAKALGKEDLIPEDWSLATRYSEQMTGEEYCTSGCGRRATDLVEVSGSVSVYLCAEHATDYAANGIAALGEEASEFVTSLTASGGRVTVFAPGTKDGPGWLTDPIPTARIRRYWVHGKGAAKIRWGVPGDFNRCRRQLAKYIPNPAWLAGTCANMHKEALGFWPGRPLSLEGEKMAPAFTEVPALTASAGELLKKEWFEDPHLSGPTPLTITEEGHIYGHVAAWGTCHIGSRGRCINVPTSASNYAYFHVGAVETDGGMVPVGHITMQTGHADLSLSATDTMAHYDNTAMVAADVRCGEDTYGVWISGAVRNHLTSDDRRALQAAALSGDWREIGGSLEMVAALAVNVPGFPIPRTAIAASGARDVALVAAGLVVGDEEDEVTQEDVIATIVRNAITEFRAQEKAFEALPDVQAYFTKGRANHLRVVRDYFEKEKSDA